LAHRGGFIGGGAIIASFFVAVFGLPVYTVAFYLLIAPWYPQQSITPDCLLGLLFGLGGMAGMYLGARAQKFVPPKLIKGMLTGILIFLAAKYIIGYFR
jgi:uncharacterized protein